MSDDDVVHDVIYPYPPARVWAALTEPEALAHWLLPNDFAPRLGHRFTFRPPVGSNVPGAVECEVVELDEPRRLAYTWRDDLRHPTTLVTFTLQPVPGGTRLRLEHTGFAALAARRQRFGTGLDPRWSTRLPRLLLLEVDTAALTDALLAFVTETRPDRRNALPVIAELRQAGTFAIPLELLETMVLDGIDQRQAVVELVASMIDRPGVVPMPA